MALFSMTFLYVLVAQSVTVLFAAGVLNWAACAGLVAWLGGSAIDGHAAAGRFYLAQGSRETEVGQSTFRWLCHYEAVSRPLLGLSILMIVAGLLWIVWSRSRQQQGSPPATESPE